MSVGIPPGQIATLKRIRRRFQRRRFYQSAVVGNEDGLIYAGLGQIWVRYRGGNDADSNVTYQQAIKVNRGGATFFEYYGAPVWVVYDRNDELAIEGVDSKEAAAANLDTALLNLGNRSSRWFRLKNATRLAGRPVGTAANPSTLVTVRSLIYDNDYGDLYRLEATARVADKVDLATYIPAAGNHAVVCIFLRTVDNTFQVTSSTVQALATDIDLTDYQECFALRDAETIPIQAFILSDGQTAITKADMGEDLRQFVNMPRGHGFPNPVDQISILRSGYTQTISDKLTITGKLTINGKLTIADTTSQPVYQPIGPYYLGVLDLYNSGVATILAVNASAIYNGYVYQTVPGDGQIVYCSRAYFSPGVYQIRVVHLKSTVGGIFEVSLIGPETLTTPTVDTYNGITTFNNISDNNLIITKAGEYRINVIINGKNGISTNYYASFQSLSISKQ